MIIKPDIELAKAHLKKAFHNRAAMIFFYNSEEYSDWSASAAFYCVYHCCLAILAKYGYESSSQSCTFLAIEKLIQEEKLKNITMKELKEIKDPEETLESSTKIVDIRENIQYSIRMSFQEKEFNDLLFMTNILLDKFRQEKES